MTKVLASYMGPKRPGEKYADRYSATLRDGRVWFTGGSSSHSVSAGIPLKDINAHWRGYCGQGRYQASPKAITRKVWAAALEEAARSSAAPAKLCSPSEDTMTTKISAIIITGNIRDVDNCDSDAAIDNIMAAAEKAGEEFAEKHDVTVTVGRHISERERQSQTAVVWGHTEGEAEYDGTTDRLCEALADHLNAAIDRAIENGDWLDA